MSVKRFAQQDARTIVERIVASVSAGFEGEALLILSAEALAEAGHCLSVAALPVFRSAAAALAKTMKEGCCQQALPLSQRKMAEGCSDTGALHPSGLCLWAGRHARCHEVITDRDLSAAAAPLDLTPITRLIRRFQFVRLAGHPGANCR